MKTLIFQSHPPVAPKSWVQQCLSSVNNWADSHQYDYRLLDDELFRFIPPPLQQKFNHQKVILTDLARVQWAQYFLNKGYDEVLWLDSDFLIFNPGQFDLPRDNHRGLGYALGREVWVQRAKSGNGLKVYKKVHNAALYFQQGNVFADFYIAHANKLLSDLEGRVPPQFIGPKLLTALHNVLGCPVMEYAGMLSPLVIRDMLNGGGEALALLLEISPCPLSGANLCASLVGDDQAIEKDLGALVALLLDRATL